MLGITTYCKSQERLQVIKKSFDSLIGTISTNEIVVVDDASTMREHLEYIESLGIRVIKRTANGGYSKAKNMLIKDILERGYDIGFLADDDNLYTNGRKEQYLEAVQKTGIDHFCLRLKYSPLDGQHYNNGEVSNMNGVDIRQTPLVNGCFYTFTRRMIEKIGYMNEMPAKLGHEHSIFTQRAIRNGFSPTYIDVAIPKITNIQVSGDNYVVSIEDAYDKENLRKNGEMFNIDYTKFYPYHD